MVPKEQLLKSTPKLVDGVDYSNIKLTPKEAFLLSRIDGRLTVADIAKISSMSIEETLGAVLGLALKEVIQFREFGLERVTLSPVPIKVWQARNWSLRVGDRAVPSFFLVNAGFTGPEGVRAPLVYVGQGRPKDLDRKDVSGKIVVADVPFPYLPTGLLLTFLKFLGASYFISDPRNSITLRRNGL